MRIPLSPSFINGCNRLTLMTCGRASVSSARVHISLLLHSMHDGEINLQSKEDSHPLLTSRSLSNFPVVQVEMAVQTEMSEQAVQVVPNATPEASEMALQLNADSQPLVASPSLLNFPPVHDETLVQVEELEHDKQVVFAADVMASQS